MKLISREARLNLWNREELILAFNLYCKMPFSKFVKGNPKVIELAKILGRTPSAVAMKLGNFGRLDPELKKRNIKGLSGGSKADIVIWNEFHNDWEKLVYESEQLLAKKKGIPIEKEIQLDEKDIPLGLDRKRLIKTRVNQYFFRRAILSTYENKCCITGINIPDLLNASHIIPWSVDENNRLNPQNGLCLNVIHDRAYDKGLITITSDFRIKVSSKLIKHSNLNLITDVFLKYEDKKITLPHKFLPKEEFLEYHSKNIFQI